MLAVVVAFGIILNHCNLASPLPKTPSKSLAWKFRWEISKIRIIQSNTSGKYKTSDV